MLVVCVVLVLFWVGAIFEQCCIYCYRFMTVVQFG